MFALLSLSCLSDTKNISPKTQIAPSAMLKKFTPSRNSNLSISEIAFSGSKLKEKPCAKSSLRQKIKAEPTSPNTKNKGRSRVQEPNLTVNLPLSKGFEIKKATRQKQRAEAPSGIPKMISQYGKKSKAGTKINRSRQATIPAISDLENPSEPIKALPLELAVIYYLL
jgi:hypothetical protein